VNFQDIARKLLHSAVPASLRNAVKMPFYALRSNLRWSRRALNPAISLAELSAGIAASGLTRGDVVCVHGSLSKLGNVEGGPSTVITALQAAVGEEGAILMPTYGSAQEVCEQGRVVDLRREPSRTGALTEAFRLSPDVFRSSHPFSSFCAWGARAAHFVGNHADDPRICHEGSPLARFYQARGKILGIGIGLGPVSFYHVVEDSWEGYPLQVYLPPQSVRYIDASGASVNRPVQRYKPELSRIRIDSRLNPWIRRVFTDRFDAAGLLHRFQLGMAPSWIIDSAQMYDLVRNLAIEGLTIYATSASSTLGSCSTCSRMPLSGSKTP